MTWVAVVTLWLAAASAALAIAFRHRIAAAWREPVLRSPVVILESDDWGYGPVEQSGMLKRLAELLAGFHDRTGRSPVMTLGVVLAGPDTATMRSEECRRYSRIGIGDPRLAGVRDAMLAGAERGVFALQLHGREHFWPDSLVRVARRSAWLREWLATDDMPSTELLPSPLQSRWTDAEHLPSRPLPVDAIDSEAMAEVRAFANAFAVLPQVAVPPTFLWNRDVEAAWVRAGVDVVVTPGRRNTARSADGGFVREQEEIYNGAHGDGGCMYVVRDVYFEPALGHERGRAVADVIARSRLGRPALIEIHRSNFLADPAAVERALGELARFIGEILTHLPGVRFMSTAELATHYRDFSDLTETRTFLRLHFLLRRLSAIPRLRKFAWMTGAILPAGLAFAITRPRPW